jgi:hypothetical protein
LRFFPSGSLSLTPPRRPAAPAQRTAAAARLLRRGEAGARGAAGARVGEEALGEEVGLGLLEALHPDHVKLEAVAPVAAREESKTSRHRSGWAAFLRSGLDVRRGRGRGGEGRAPGVGDRGDLLLVDGAHVRLEVAGGPGWETSHGGRHSSMCPRALHPQTRRCRARAVSGALNGAGCGADPSFFLHSGH